MVFDYTRVLLERNPRKKLRVTVLYYIILRMGENNYIESQYFGRRTVLIHTTATNVAISVIYYGLHLIKYFVSTVRFT